jgi:hypothetical protein
MKQVQVKIPKRPTPTTPINTKSPSGKIDHKN